MALGHLVLRSPAHHLTPFRWLLGRLKPFLPVFWGEDVTQRLNDALKQNGKTLAGEPQVEYCFGKFYRVMRFDIVEYAQAEVT